MRISGDWLTGPGTQGLCSALTAAGYRALFVGGCVRNALLRVPVKDIDLATDALPQIVTSLAENAGFRVVPTGIEHGTVTIIARGVAHEVTTFRRDVQTFGRHATVAFSDDVEEDAMRRDFTMNALYALPTGEVIDPMGGLPDLLARRVRFVGSADLRIAEDYLRILRFFRFHAIYGDPAQGLDADGLAACAGLAEGINTLSRERIGSEMRKLLGADDPAPSVAAMAQAGVLSRVLPGADARALPVLVHLEETAPPVWLRRLAVLGGEDAAQRLRLSRAEASRLALLRNEIGSGGGPGELGYRHGAQVATDVLLARAALLETPLAVDWQAQVAEGAAAKLPVTAADLMPALQGAALGERLREIETRWIASGFRLTRDALLG